MNVKLSWVTVYSGVPATGISPASARNPLQEAPESAWPHPPDTERPKVSEAKALTGAGAASSGSFDLNPQIGKLPVKENPGSHIHTKPD